MKHRKRAAALIITAALALGLLAAAVRQKRRESRGATPGTAAEGSGSVWRAEKRKIDGLEGNMDAKAAAGDKLYFSTAPGYDAEGENTDSVQLWSVPLEGARRRSSPVIRRWPFRRDWRARACRSAR